MVAIRFTARMVAGALRAIAIVAGVLVVGAGVPFAWIWIGSQLQGGTAPSLSGLGVTLAGIIASYWLLAMAFAWIVERARGEQLPVRYAWNRSLRDQPARPGQTTHALEEVVVIATLLVGLVCTVVFFLFGNPGVPVSP